MSYQTYIPDEWREMQAREREETAKAAALHTAERQERAARLKKVLFTAGKVIGWIAVGLVALLLLMAALLGISGGRRRR